MTMSERSTKSCIALDAFNALRIYHASFHGFNIGGIPRSSQKVKISIDFINNENKKCTYVYICSASQPKSVTFQAKADERQDRVSYQVPKYKNSM